MARLEKKLKYTGTMQVLTGIHIGDSKENVQIGGIDSPVVRRKDNNQPYIPGSSLKGKMRCLLEQVHGADIVGRSSEVNALFGITENRKDRIEEQKPSRLIVRDGYLTKASAEELGNSEFTDYPFTEVKFENTIDRIKGTAGNPRKFERVPAGAAFQVEFILNVWDTDNEQELKDMLKQGLELLQNDYLGGAGSRGYGQVQFEIDLDKPEVVFQNELAKENG